MLSAVPPIWPLIGVFEGIIVRRFFFVFTSERASRGGEGKMSGKVLSFGALFLDRRTALRAANDNNAAFAYYHDYVKHRRSPTFDTVGPRRSLHSSSFLALLARTFQLIINDIFMMSRAGEWAGNYVIFVFLCNNRDVLFFGKWFWVLFRLDCCSWLRVVTHNEDNLTRRFRESPAMFCCCRLWLCCRYLSDF